jgi:DNA replication and repair protein RecF
MTNEPFGRATGGLEQAQQTLELRALTVRGFRNLERVDLELGQGLTVLAGPNGAGKTSLLEAIYFAATSRCFRASRPAEAVSHGASEAFVRARFLDAPDGGSREQVASIVRGVTRVRIDGNKPPTLASYAVASPVVLFHPGELALSQGPASGRRTLLDRVALFLDPSSADARARYTRAQRSRHELLRSPACSAAALESFEALAARHGAELTRARARAFEVLERHAREAFSSIASPELELGLRYVAGGSPDEAEGVAELAARRERDRHRPSASFGPHRDELELSLSGRSARVVASQGQHRALTLALKAAEAGAVASARGLLPLLLFDDVSSELDPARTVSLFAFLGLSRAQMVLTTTRGELIRVASRGSLEVRELAVCEGRVSPP